MKWQIVSSDDTTDGLRSSAAGAGYDSAAVVLRWTRDALSTTVAQCITCLIPCQYGKPRSLPACRVLTPRRSRASIVRSSWSANRASDLPASASRRYGGGRVTPEHPADLSSHQPDEVAEAGTGSVARPGQVVRASGERSRADCQRQSRGASPYSSLLPPGAPRSGEHTRPAAGGGLRPLGGASWSPFG